MTHATLAAAYVVGYAALSWGLAGYPFLRAVVGSTALVVPAAAVTLVILRRRRAWLGCQRLFWDAFGIGMALWVVGHLGWMADAFVLGDPSWIRWHTIFTLCGGIGPLVALLARPHRGVRGSSTAPMAILLASYALLAVFLYSYFVLIPGMLSAGGHAEMALLVLVQANRLLLLVGLAAAAWDAGRTRWRRTYLILLGGVTAGFFLRLFTSRAIATGEYQSGTLLDLAWLLPFLAYIIAALDAPASTAAADGEDAAVCPAFLCAMPVLVMPLVGYGVLFAQPLGAAADSMRGLVTGLVTVGCLGLLALRLSVQGGALQRADQRVKLLAAAIEQTGDAIVITRADGTFEHANDAFLRSVGYSREDLAALTSADLTDPASDVIGADIFRDVKHRGLWRGMLVRRRKDGSAYHASCTVVALRDAHGRITHLVGVERDMTDDLQRRDQLVHAERLSAVGALVAGIAHEINNPLQTILGTAELMLEERENASAHRELQLVRREAGRAAQIVRNLLSFVRRSTPDRTSIDLNAIVRATVELRQYHLERSNIRLDVRLHGGPLPVLVNREEIQQIVLNLLVNAEHALEAVEQDATITVRTFPIGGQQCLEFADNGPGISKELRGKIFEPFFTTKEVGQGTGLGLSISHGIALAHGGSLELCGNAGRGACFRLLLPADAYHTDTVPAASAPAGKRVALVVDDEIPIRRLLARLLQRRGFEVIEAASGDAALEVFSRTTPEIVLCDVRMPGMGGLQLYSRVAASLPHLRGRFVFMSGDSGQVQAGGISPDVPTLTKPFSAADLDAVLQQTRV